MRRNSHLFLPLINISQQVIVVLVKRRITLFSCTKEVLVCALYVHACSVIAKVPYHIYECSRSWSNIVLAFARCEAPF